MKNSSIFVEFTDSYNQDKCKSTSKVRSSSKTISFRSMHHHFLDSQTKKTPMKMMMKNLNSKLLWTMAVMGGNAKFAESASLEKKVRKKQN